MDMRLAEADFDVIIHRGGGGGFTPILGHGREVPR